MFRGETGRDTSVSRPAAFVNGLSPAPRGDGLHVGDEVADLGRRFTFGLVQAQIGGDGDVDRGTELAPVVMHRIVATQAPAGANPVPRPALAARGYEFGDDAVEVSVERSSAGSAAASSSPG